MTTRGIEGYKSTLYAAEQAKARVSKQNGNPAGATGVSSKGQDTVEISQAGMDRYRESVAQSATALLQNCENGKGVMMTDFRTIIGGRMPSTYGEKNASGEYTRIYYSAEETASNLQRAYTELRNEIAQGYESGKKELYVEDRSSEKGYRKLTKDEALAELDKARQEYAGRYAARNDQKAIEVLSAHAKRVTSLSGGRAKIAGEAVQVLKSSQNDDGAAYLKGLQEQFPKMSFSVGTGLIGKTAQNTGDNANRWAFTVSPKLLEKMRGDPEAEAEYMRKLRDIERATSLAEGFSKALGMKTTYCENYIDENGQLHHTSISVRKDEMNEKLRAEARENAEKMIERVREKNSDAADKLEELLNKVEETGELVLGDEEMRVFSSTAKLLESTQKKDDGDRDDEAVGGASRSSGCVAINAAKLARMLAAAKTQAQVRAVIAQIQSDLKECDAGKAQGFDVDESSVEAAKSVLQEAQQRMGQVENREATPEEEMASALASLM